MRHVAMLYVQVENFNSQVVAGIRYTFDLVLGLVNSPVKFKNLIAKSASPIVLQ